MIPLYDFTPPASQAERDGIESGSNADTCRYDADEIMEYAERIGMVPV